MGGLHPPKTPLLLLKKYIYSLDKMMRQSEFKMRFDPELGRYTRQHIYGEGMMDVFKSIGSNYLERQ